MSAFKREGRGLHAQRTRFKRGFISSRTFLMSSDIISRDNITVENMMLSQSFVRALFLDCRFFSLRRSASARWKMAKRRGDDTSRTVQDKAAQTGIHRTASEYAGPPYGIRRGTLRARGAREGFR